MSMDVEYVINKKTKSKLTDVNGFSVIRKAVGTIENIRVELTLKCGYFVGMWNMETTTLETAKITLRRYDSDYYITKYFANRNFDKLKKKYNLKEVYEE